MSDTESTIATSTTSSLQSDTEANIFSSEYDVLHERHLYNLSICRMKFSAGSIGTIRRVSAWVAIPVCVSLTGFSVYQDLRVRSNAVDQCLQDHITNNTTWSNCQYQPDATIVPSIIACLSMMLVCGTSALYRFISEWSRVTILENRHEKAFTEASKALANKTLKLIGDDGSVYSQETGTYETDSEQEMNEYDKNIPFQQSPIITHDAINQIHLSLKIFILTLGIVALSLQRDIENRNLATVIMTCRNDKDECDEGIYAYYGFIHLMFANLIAKIGSDSLMEDYMNRKNFRNNLRNHIERMETIRCAYDTLNNV